MVILTKDAILKGIDKVEKCEIKSLGGEIYLRPLSQGEWAELEDIEARAIGVFETNESAKRKGKRQLPGTMSSSGKISLEKTSKAKREAQTLAIKYSLNNDKNQDKWTEKEISKLPKKAFEEIYDAIEWISGVEGESLEEEIDDFPENK